jgi:hypothetical protein
MQGEEERRKPRNIRKKERNIRKRVPFPYLSVLFPNVPWFSSLLRKVESDYVTLNDRHQATLWVSLCVIVAVALAFLFPDSVQQDGGYHFLFSRWAWRHPELFVGVWARPLFTTVFAFPALGGYLAAKLFAAAIAAAIAWQTYRLAMELGLDRAALAIPLVFAQPSFFVVSADTMTEPIFALVLVRAMRLDQAGRHRLALLAVSLLILARPEGFFVALLWAFWFIKEQRGSSWVERFASLGIMAAGCFIWWLAAFLITGDVMFIAHNWPSSWPITGTIYGTGSWWNYVFRLPEIVGPLLIPCFVAGVVFSIRSAKLGKPLGLFVLFFVLHTILRKFGLLGSAGYPRYFVAISPAIALLTLSGWDFLSSRTRLSFSVRVRSVVTACVLGVSALLNFAYFDGAEWIRDTRAVRSMHQWFEGNRVPVSRLIWSQAYMCIAFDHDPWENYSFTGDKQRDLGALRESPKGTLVFWEDRFGPKWHGFTAEDFAEAGYELIHKEEFVLKGYVLPRAFFGLGGPRSQRMYFLYKR